MWRLMAARAWAEAAKSVGLESRERVAVALLIQALISIGLFVWATDPASGMLVRGLTAAAPFALFPILFAWKWISLPPALARERATAASVAVEDLAQLMVQATRAQQQLIGTGDEQAMRVFRADWIHRAAKLIQKHLGETFAAEFVSANSTAPLQFPSLSERGARHWNDLEAKKSVLARFIAHMRTS